MLNDEYIKLVNERRQRVTLDEYAEYLSNRSGKRISNVNLSRWMNAKHLPAGDNAHALAAVFGSQVYDILGVPHFVPSTTAISLIEKNWHKLTTEERKKSWILLKEVLTENLSSAARLLMGFNSFFNGVIPTFVYKNVLAFTFLPPTQPPAEEVYVG